MSTGVDDSSMPLIEHLTELRQRLIRAVIVIGVLFVACFAVSDTIFTILAQPYLWGSGKLEVDFQNIALEGIFIVQLQIALFAAVFLAFPVVATELYKFVAPGLYANERRAFLPFLFATPVLFILGSLLVYYFILPLASAFFLSQQQAGIVSITTVPDVQRYLGLVMKLLFAFGLAFQLPVLLTLLARAELVTADGLKRKWKWAIVITVVMAAVLTPPDPVSQIGLAVPILLLYQLSILSARLVEKQRAEREAAEEAALGG